jgi:hypothetical protein
MRRFNVTCLLAMLALFGCSTATRVERIGPERGAAPPNCQVVVLERSASPNPSSEAIGKVESHIQRNFFLGGKVSLEDAYKELRAKACELGGDLVHVDDWLDSSAAEMTHLHVWATVYRTPR